MMEVTVVGLGYIGLPTALMLAAGDFKVTGVDSQADKIRHLQAGKTDFAEQDYKHCLTRSLRIFLLSRIILPVLFILWPYPRRMTR